MRSRSPAWLENLPATGIDGRLHRQDADGVDVAVVVQAGVGALAVPVGAVLARRERRVGGADRGDAALRAPRRAG